MPLTSSFGLDPEISERFRKLGYAFGPSSVELSRAIFAERVDKSLPDGAIRKDDLAYGDHDRHRLDVCTPAGAPRPIVLFVPGGGMTSGDKTFYAHIPAFFAREGFVGVAMNYRLAPEFRFPAGAQDVARAIDWLAEHGEALGGDPQRIFVIAQSAGAVHAASALFDGRCRPTHFESLRGAALMSGVFKVTPDHEGVNINLYFGTDPSQLMDRSPSSHAAKSIPVPVVITVAEMEPGFFGLSAAALIEELTLRDGHAPEFVWLRGHNHLSPVLNMGNSGDRLGPSLAEHFRGLL